MANYDIETKDIFLYEKEAWRKTGDSELYKKLIIIIQPIIGRSDKPIPIRARGYAFRSLIDDVKMNKIGSSNLFVYPHSGDCFSYDHNEHVVYLKDIEEPDFAFLFALKLRQYNSNLIELDAFLSHQIKTNYHDDMKAFKYLVIRILKEYKQWLAPIIEDMINLWGNNYNSGNTINGDAPLIRANDCNASSSNNASFLKEDGSKAKKYPSNAVLIEDLPTSPEETEDSTKMPKDYYYLEGKWTDAEVQLFFTFLYKEKDKNGETYLSKEATETIFKYGIAIPPEGTIVTRYKLNDGGPRSKKIVAYAIYLFFKNYSRNITEKRAILRFFGSYIEDYSAALVDEDTMVKLSGNITGDKPAKNFFNLRKYVPARVADFFKF